MSCGRGGTLCIYSNVAFTNFSLSHANTSYERRRYPQYPDDSKMQIRQEILANRYRGSSSDELRDALSP